MKLETPALTCVVLVVTGLLSAAAVAAPAVCHYTTDEGVKGANPAQGNWTALPPGGAITLTLAVDEKIWIACENELVLDKQKYFQLTIDKVNLVGVSAENDGFTTNDDSKAVNKGVLTGHGVAGGKLRIRYRFGKPQPLWERVAFKALAPINGVVYNVSALHMCAKTKPPWPKQELKDGVFGLADPISARINEILVFPLNAPVDINVPPTFSADGTTGDWTSSFVGTDPDGGARDLGGVRWVSDGAGLSTTDVFSLDFAMEGQQPAVLDYDLYIFETQSGVYLDMLFDGVDDTIPTVSAWGLVVIALLVLAGGTIVIARSRATTVQA